MTKAAPDQASRLEHRRLRSAIEFAIAFADAGQRRRPPLSYPPELKAAVRAYGRGERLPAPTLGPLRRAIEADETFRRRLADAVVPELVDPIGREWLQREDGWEARIARLAAAADEAADEADAAGALRRAERRREAAEQVAVRTRAELVAQRARTEDAERALAEARQRASAGAAEAAAARAGTTEARTAARHANDRAAAASERLGALEAARDEALAHAAAAEAQRDALLAERAERQGAGVSVRRLGELRELARAARAVAEGLAGLVDVPTPARRPLALPGGVSRQSWRATEFLLRSGAVVLVDGYNVAMLAWPDVDLAGQRERLLDLVDDVARRYGTELVVVFDGADVIGAHSTTRRMARVTFSSPGVIADDVIRAEVVAGPPGRPVVVVTNDQALRRDVQALGANAISSDAFVALARRA